MVDLAEYLVKMGARIKGFGTDRIEIEGVSKLSPARHKVMPDRIETGTYMVAAAITGGDLTLQRANPQHLEAVTSKLREAGVQVEEKDHHLRVVADGKLRGVDIRTAPYPGFPTDMQAQMMALLSLADGGLSVITETIFENRFQHALETQRMGANLKLEGGRGGDRREKTLRRQSDGHRPTRECVARAGRAGRGGDHRGLARLPPGPGLRADGEKIKRLRGEHPEREGRMKKLDSRKPGFEKELAAILRERAAFQAGVEEKVAQVFKQVASGGGKALLGFAKKFDGFTGSAVDLKVDKKEIGSRA